MSNLSLSKGGSHVDLNRADGYPTARSIFSNEDIGLAVASSSAEALVVFGHWRLSDDVKRAGLGVKTGEQMAREYWEVTDYFVDKLRSAGATMGNIAFVGYNEPVLSADEMAQYAEFERWRMILAEERGLTCAIGSFSVGSPPVEHDDDIWDRFYPALEQAHLGRHVLALHEYWASCPAMWYGPNQTEAYENDEVIPFFSGYYEGWLACRYRKVWRLHISPNNWTNIRIVITECGADFIPGGDAVIQWIGGQERGWRDWVGLWRLKWHDDALKWLSDLADSETITLEAAKWLQRELVNQLKDGDQLSDEWLYFATLLWYDEQTRRDHYVVGWQVFTDGSFGWGNFDISGDVHDMLYTYLQLMTPG